jgi:hypothetical protein
VRTSDVARMDFPAGLTQARQASPGAYGTPSATPTQAHRAARETAAELASEAPSRAHREVAPRPDFCHSITARLDDELTTNDLQASSGNWNWPVNRGNWWAVQDLNL